MAWVALATGKSKKKKRKGNRKTARTVDEQGRGAWEGVRAWRAKREKGKEGKHSA